MEDNDTEFRQYQIVGVDKAVVAKGNICFISLISKVLIGKEVGEKRH